MAFKPRKIDTKPDRKKIDKLTKVYIATPAYDGRILTDYGISIAETCAISPYFGIQVEASVMGNGAFIDLARNLFVKFFLQTDNEFLFFIDADLKWESRAFISLVQQNLPICAGAYPKRQDPEEYPVTFWEREDKGPWVTQTGDPDSGPADSGWVQCTRVPTGFLCIRRDTVEMMVKHHPTQVTSNGDRQPLLFAAEHFIRNGKRMDSIDLINGDLDPSIEVDFIGEDYYFCERYTKITGKPIPVYADFDFVHGKDWKGNWHQFLAKQSIEEGAKKENTSEAA